MSVPDYETFPDFARAVTDELPDEWDTRLDEVSLDETNGTQAGYQRDDLYTWMILLPNDEEWPPSKLIVYLPGDLDMVPDRPGIPVHTLEDVSVEAVVDFLTENAPDYEGTFTYDDV